MLAKAPASSISPLEPMPLKRKRFNRLGKLKRSDSPSSRTRKKAIAIQKAEAAVAKHMGETPGAGNAANRRQAAEAAAAETATRLGIPLAEAGKLSRREAFQAAETAAARSLGEQPNQGNPQTRRRAAELAAAEAARRQGVAIADADVSKAEARQAAEIAADKSLLDRTGKQLKKDRRAARKEAEAAAIAAADRLGKSVKIAGIKTRREARLAAAAEAKKRRGRVKP